MKADHARGVLGRHAQRDDRNRRRVGRQNGTGIRHGLVEDGEDFGLDGLVLDDGLADDVPVGEAVEFGGESQSQRRLFAFTLGELAARHSPIERAQYPRPATGDELTRRFVDQNVCVRPGTYLGDPRAHLARTDHADTPCVRHHCLHSDQRRPDPLCP
ncbi:Uncharacterised protein [Mycobacteroides abscessus subsp. abscessus]|nr:Uncharacterised protein [Mycobacteroides abscessus subsp. abscessus]